LRNFDIKGTTGPEITNLRRKILALDAAMVLVPERIPGLKVSEVTRLAASLG
jgi:hypothetical protein